MVANIKRCPTFFGGRKLPRGVGSVVRTPVNHPLSAWTLSLLHEICTSIELSKSVPGLPCGIGLRGPVCYWSRGSVYCLRRPTAHIRLAFYRPDMKVRGGGEDRSRFSHHGVFLPCGYRCVVAPLHPSRDDQHASARSRTALRRRTRISFGRGYGAAQSGQGTNR